MNAGCLSWLIDAATGLLLLLPLATLTYAGYDTRLWWQLSETDLLPFNTRVVVRVPIALWYLLSWIIALCAVGVSEWRGTIAYLALAVALVETVYILLRAGKAIAPLRNISDGGVVAFALGHNALTEEVLFRGIPLWIATLFGISHQLPWQYGFVLTTGLAFGLYHRALGQHSRFYDTAVFGCVLGTLALWNGFASAVLVHTIRNALALPLGQSMDSLPRWRRRRACYAVSLIVVAAAGIGLDG